MDPEQLADVIGANVRRLRAERGLSLDGLAAAADLSKGTVVAIEQQRSNPSVATLCALSEALQVGLMTLLEPDAGPLVRHRTPSEAIELWSTATGSSARLLLGTDPPNAVEVWSWTMAPGDEFDGSAHPRGTVETLHVTSGRIGITVGTRSLVAAAGDAVAFEGHVGHRYVGVGDELATFSMWITVGDPGTLPPMTHVGADQVAGDEAAAV